ncbi:hypothetical protein NDU88_002560 [Pleurodeles waltl]|uniref:Myb/SANT-like DNA-binding domain-containing protein n=1 Tax=Pleurodeles waltl TaxID=8319 RepID=A0AAV7UY28_PLEWA|nr:hypothetical protein NDU88_002560 [Pleurodeles waltl]
MCCCDLCLEPTMARVIGERAPAFTLAEFERLVDGVLPQYGLLYGPPDQQISIHQKKGIWCAIAKDVRTLGVYGRRSTHCQKWWGDLRRWARKTAEAHLGMASQRGRGARRTLTPLMARILAVAYPELDGRLRASQHPQGCVYSAHHYSLRTVGWRLSSPSSLSFVFVVEQHVEDHGEDMQFGLHGGMVVPCVSNGEFFHFCAVFPPSF